MSIKVEPEKMRAIELSGYGLNGYIGGLARNTYWTPDGRVIRAIPNIREWIKKDKDGRVIEHGIRDANLDRGWLQSPPQIKKPYCQTCDEWHDTQEEIEKCKAAQEAKIAKFEVEAKADLLKEQQEKDTRIEALEKQIAQLSAMVQKLTEAKGNGKVL